MHIHTVVIAHFEPRTRILRIDVDAVLWAYSADCCTYLPLLIYVASFKWRHSDLKPPAQYCVVPLHLSVALVHIRHTHGHLVSM